MSKSLRILWVLPNPAYLRFFASVVRELCDRRHTVLLAFETPKGAAREAWTEVPAGVQVVEPLPVAATAWTRWLDDAGRALDSVRFSSPGFHDKPYLRARMRKYVPDGWQWTHRIGRIPGWTLRAGHQLMRAGERAAPPQSPLLGRLRELAPDLVVISPLVLRGSGSMRQGQVVRAVRAYGAPVVLAVGSWDHLSSKSLIKSDLDAVLVWNSAQAREAQEMHGVPAKAIQVVGAPAFDRWFAFEPTLTREAFLRQVGLEPAERLLLYVGSSPNITAVDREVEFVREWVAALRTSGRPELAAAAVLVRPHPGTTEAWMQVDLALPHVVVWPPARPSFPMSDLEAADFFHSLYFSDAVVGINTSAMIEAAIVGRGVFTLQTPHFADTQTGTVHFGYLVATQGGCAQTAPTFQQHCRQLSQFLYDGDEGDIGDGEAAARQAARRAARDRFVREFVRPHHLNYPAGRAYADALERAAEGGTSTPAIGWADWLMRPWLVSQLTEAAERGRRRRQAERR